MNRDALHKRLIEVAAESPAKKRKVGAVLVRLSPLLTNEEQQYHIIAEGYNFNLDGGPCENADGSTHENVIHAEVNCINNIPAHMKGLLDPAQYIMFVTHPPCDGCKAFLLKEDLKFEVMGDFLKFDSKKPRLSLVPGSLVNSVGTVMTYGAKKYKVDNWRKVEEQEPYWNALERHLAAYKQGELRDPESGLLHIEHIACNAAFLIELQHLPLRKED